MGRGKGFEGLLSRRKRENFQLLQESDSRSYGCTRETIGEEDCGGALQR